MKFSTDEVLHRELIISSRDESSAIELNGEQVRLKFDLIEFELQKSEIVVRFMYQNQVVTVQSHPAHLSNGDTFRLGISGGYGTVPIKWS